PRPATSGPRQPARRAVRTEPEAGRCARHGRSRTSSGCGNGSGYPWVLFLLIKPEESGDGFRISLNNGIAVRPGHDEPRISNLAARISREHPWRQGRLEGHEGRDDGLVTERPSRGRAGE